MQKLSVDERFKPIPSGLGQALVMNAGPRRLVDPEDIPRLTQSTNFHISPVFMSMSLFTSFDALCAESFGQKVGLSWAPGAKKQQGSSSDVAVVSERKAVDDANKSQVQHQLQQHKRRQRFAVELDGVHCFETIIPY
ncbi:hypothetical protein ACH5RR_019860 [Cinchona calisaya]|uniref:Uncharacterized protein n=1 Tax=Cinchona calisaya TaxID=153742 RepID=A0ABD2ZS95_9GENT